MGDVSYRRVSRRRGTLRPGGGALRCDVLVWLLAGVLLAAGCVRSSAKPRPPVERPPDRVLLLDAALAPAEHHASLVRRFNLLGYDVTYRWSYPHLTEEDVRQYGVVVLLGARMPWFPGYRFTEDDERLAVRFVRRGGLLVLGTYPGSPNESTGDADRGTFNEILDGAGVPILIGDDHVLDPGRSYRAPLFDGLLAEVPNQGGRLVPVGLAPPIRVRGPAVLLLEASPRAVTGAGLLFHRAQEGGRPSTDPSVTIKGKPYAVAAACRSGNGWVLVAPRTFLDVLTHMNAAPVEPLVETNLAGLTEEYLGEVLEELEAAWRGGRRMEELSLGTYAARDLPVARVSHPMPPRRHGAPMGPPAGTVSFVRDAVLPGLEEEAAPPPEQPVAPPLRVGWGSVREPGPYVEDLVQRMSEAGVTTLWGEFEPETLQSPFFDDVRRELVVAQMDHVADVCETNDVRWFVGMRFPGRVADPRVISRLTGAQGERLRVPSPWDPAAWERTASTLREVSRYASVRPAVGGVVLDLEMYGMPQMLVDTGFDFSHAAYFPFLSELLETGADLPEILQPHWAQFVLCAAACPADGRAEWLEGSGLLGPYHRHLEGRAVATGRRLRAALDEARSDLVLGFYTASINLDPLYRGLLRGASQPDRPVAWFTFSPDPDRLVPALREAGIHARLVQGVLLGRLRPEEFGHVLGRAQRSPGGGFWLNRITTLVGREDHYAEEAPRGYDVDQAWSAIRAALRGPRDGEGE